MYLKRKSVLRSEKMKGEWVETGRFAKQQPVRGAAGRAGVWDTGRAAQRKGGGKRKKRRINK